jgi:hypothetical protein
LSQFSKTDYLFGELITVSEQALILLLELGAFFEANNRIKHD